MSGRGVDDVKSKVGIENITYAGNHGLEIHHADGTKYVHPIPDSNIKELVKLANNIFSSDYYRYLAYWKIRQTAAACRKLL